MDITAAFITWAPRGVTPLRILQGIASALLGPRSFEGGPTTGALGAVIHFFIAFSAATVFYAASRKLPLLIHRPILFGILYGVAVYVVMYWIVLPLAHFQGAPRNLFNSIVAIVTHIICVGLPISMVVSRSVQAVTNAKVMNRR
jgi:uncharacterized membrane protein YagU involved in acid resistance